MKNFLDIAYSSKKKQIYLIYPEKLITHLVKNFNIKKNSKILEPGFGRGEFLKQFENLDMQVYGMDYTKYTENKGFEINGKMKFMTQKNFLILMKTIF